MLMKYFTSSSGFLMKNMYKGGDVTNIMALSASTHKSLHFIILTPIYLILIIRLVLISVLI